MSSKPGAPRPPGTSSSVSRKHPRPFGPVHDPTRNQDPLCRYYVTPEFRRLFPLHEATERELSTGPFQIPLQYASTRPRSRTSPSTPCGVYLSPFLEGLPAKLKHANLYPIPKTSGLLVFEKMRPITLLEIGYKLTTGWLAHTIRQRAASAPHPLWEKNQYGGNGGTHDALFRFGAALEDARDHPATDIWACLADVEAAYDSVSPQSKSLTYRKAGMPENFINFAFNLDTQAYTSVLVPEAPPANSFLVHSGFRQGDPLSVIGWLLLINPLIQWLNRGIPTAPSPLSYVPPPDSTQAKYNGTHTRHDHLPVAELYCLHHGGGKTDPLFYMDDASYLTATRRGLIDNLERMSLYLAFHDVHTHPDKTVFSRRPPHSSPTSSTSPAPSPPAVYTHGSWSPIKYIPPTHHLTYLGVHFDLHGAWRHQRAALSTRTNILLNTLIHHNASLPEARYVIDSVVHASARYRTAIVPYSPADLATLDTQCIRALNRAARLPRSAPHWRWPAPTSAGGSEYETLSIKSLQDQLTLVTLWLTDPQRGPKYHTITARLIAHGLTYGLPTSPLFMSLASEPGSHKLYSPHPSLRRRRSERSLLCCCHAICL